MFIQPEKPTQLTNKNQVDGYIAQWRRITNQTIDKTQENLDALVKKISKDMDIEQQIKIQELVKSDNRGELRKILSAQPDQLKQLEDAKIE